VTVDANNHVFVANEGGSTLSSFSNANGVLTLIGTYATGTNPYAVTVNAAGLVLVANVTSNDVTVFSNANGVLTLIGTYATGITQPGAAVIDSTDHLILTSYNGNTVSSFS
jgi:6-phosphogluconolactonase (cycloisomerase 2 family)